MLHSKKALSPLIASVLLIVVVVGIGAVVTGVVRGLITENKDTITSKDDEIACSRDVNIDVVKIDGVQQVCKGTGYIDVVLDNSGSAVIDDFQLVVMGDGGFARNESIGAGAFAQGQAMELNATYAGTVGTIQQVRFVPKLKKTGSADYIFCNDVAYKTESVPDC